MQLTRMYSPSGGNSQVAGAIELYLVLAWPRIIVISPSRVSAEKVIAGSRGRNSGHTLHTTAGAINIYKANPLLEA